MSVRTLILALCGAALLLAPGAIPTAPEADAQSSILRNSTRNLGRAVQSQTRAIFRPTLTIRGNLGPVQGLTIDSGWTHAATVLGNGAVTLWDLLEGTEAQRFPNPGLGQLREIRVGPGGDFVLLGSAGNQARLLPAAGNSGLAPLPAAAATGVGALGVTPNGTQAIVGRTDGTILRVTLTSGAATTLHQASAPVTHVAQTDNGAFAAATAGGGLLLGGPGGVRPVQPAGAVTALSMAPDGTVVVGTQTGAVETWNAATGQRLAANTAHGGPVTAVAIAEGGVAVSGDASGRLVRHVGGSATPAAAPLPGRIAGLAVRANPSRILAASADGTVHVLDGQSFRQLARMISNQGGWAVVSPEGRYDGAIDTYRDVVWSTPAADMPIDTYASTLYEPGLLSKAVQPGMTLRTQQPPVAISQEIRLPPEVSLSVSPASGAQAGQTLTVTVTAINPSDDTIPRVRLFNNGKRVQPDAIVNESTGTENGNPSRTVTFGVPAVAGANQFSAVGLGWQDGESQPAGVTVQAAGAGGAGQLYLTSVGINAYRASGLQALNFAANDARAVSGLFKGGMRTPYAGVRDTLLLDGNATKGSILAHLKSLRTVTDRDVVVVYLAGHGKALDDDWYFLAADIGSGSASAIRAQGISAAELADSLRRIPAQKVLLLVDSCGSGAALQQFDGFEQRRFLDSLSRETGVHVLTAARAGQEAPEYRILNHGLFTYAFLQGFAGGSTLQADRAPRDGQVTVVEIKTYVEDMVPVVVKSLEKQLAQVTGGRGGIANRTMVTPVGISRGADFVLAR
jgi:WD40 repeat protein